MSIEALNWMNAMIYKHYDSDHALIAGVQNIRLW